jgi:predicted permease
MVALVGSALFLRSLGRAQAIDLGFETAHMGVFSFNVDGQSYGRPRGEEFQRRALESVRSLPGVASATIGVNPPLAGGFLRSVFPEGMQDDPARSGILVLTDSVTPGYFATLEIPILKGRDFTEADRDGAPLAVIVNEAMADRFWPGADPIGRRFKFHGDMEYRQVVGVARTSKYIAVGEDPRPFVYAPIHQLYSGNVTLFVRSEGEPSAPLGEARKVVQQMDRDLPIVALSTVSDLVQQGFWAARMGAGLLAIFGALAVSLAAVGIYGVMSFTVGQRTREIGIRMAMGAEPGDVLRLVLVQGMVPVLLGVGAGLAVAFASARLVEGLLFGVSAADPATFVLVPAVLAAVALLASWMPARRATRIDPLVALRYE